MLYHKDAHHYRSLIRKKQRAQRVKGSLLIALSLALMLYAVPGFAVSVFDYDDQVGASTAFSTAINDHGNEAVAPEGDAAPAAAAAAPAEGAATADAFSMNQTIGPAMLANDAAVDSAKKRAEALKVVTSTQSTMVTAKAVSEQPAEQPVKGIVPAIAAFILSLVCAIFGTRMIMHSRQMLGKRITAQYSSALRAC